MSLARLCPEVLFTSRIPASVCHSTATTVRLPAQKWNFFPLHMGFFPLLVYLLFFHFLPGF